MLAPVRSKRRLFSLMGARHLFGYGGCILTRGSGIEAARLPSLRSSLRRNLHACSTFLQNDVALNLDVPLEYADYGQMDDALDYSLVGLTGGEIFHEMLARHRVPHVFGYPGGAVLPVLDAIHNTQHFNFILPRHEQGGGHMAQGYARITGKPGVCLVTSGPGATNIVTPMQDAFMDGTPLVVFCGQVPCSLIGTDAFQEADMMAISKACTKWNVRVESVESLSHCINEAFRVAVAGRPGPVLVELPKDVTSARLKFPLPKSQTYPTYAAFSDAFCSPMSLKTSLDVNSQLLFNIVKAAEMINTAIKPVLYVGQGVLQAVNGVQMVNELMLRCKLPATTTLLGLGAVDERLENSLGMLGMHGSVAANLAMQNADVIVALGARFDDRVTSNLLEFAPAARDAAVQGNGGIIHFDILERNINKVLDATVPILGNIEETLKAMLPLVRRHDDPALPKRDAWNAAVKRWKSKYKLAFESVEGAPLAQQVLVELERQLDNDYSDKQVVVCTGVGQHQMWAAQCFSWRPNMSLVTSGGLGTMGFGLPASIGAKLAQPNAIVIDVDGDASFSMTAMELATAAQFDIGVKVLLLNNSFQGMVKQWQDLFYQERYSGTKMHNPDFLKLAQSMNCTAIGVDDAAELSEAIKKFLAVPGPVVLEVKTPLKEHVYPMVPSGKALHHMQLGQVELDEADIFL